MTEKRNQKKLVKNTLPGRRGNIPTSGTSGISTKQMAKPHIRGHQVKGNVYYYYVRGTDPEIYLGSPDAILKAVKGG